MTSMKNGIHKGIYTDFDEMQLVDMSINIPPGHLQGLTCHLIVLLCMEFIIQLISITCPSILINNIDHIL